MKFEYDLYGIEPCPHCGKELCAHITKSSGKGGILTVGASLVYFEINCSCGMHYLNHRMENGYKEKLDEWFVRAEKELIKRWADRAKRIKEDKCQRLKTLQEKGLGDLRWSAELPITISPQTLGQYEQSGYANAIAELQRTSWAQTSQAVTLSPADVCVPSVQEIERWQESLRRTVERRARNEDERRSQIASAYSD